MPMSRFYFAATVAMLPMQALAVDPLSAFVECAAETDKEKRLACFDLAAARAADAEPTDPRPFWAHEEKQVGSWRVFIGADEFDDSPMASITAYDIGGPGCEESQDQRRRSLTLICRQREEQAILELRCAGDPLKMLDSSMFLDRGQKWEDLLPRYQEAILRPLEARADQKEPIRLGADLYDGARLQTRNGRTIAREALGADRLIIRARMDRGFREPIRIDLDGFDEAYAHVAEACARPEGKAAED